MGTPSCRPFPAAAVKQPSLHRKSVPAMPVLLFQPCSGASQKKACPVAAHPFHVQVPLPQQGGGTMPHLQLKQGKIPEPFGVIGSISMPQRVRTPFSKAVVQPPSGFFSGAASSAPANWEDITVRPAPCSVSRQKPPEHSMNGDMPDSPRFTGSGPYGNDPLLQIHITPMEAHHLPGLIPAYNITQTAGAQSRNSGASTTVRRLPISSGAKMAIVRSRNEGESTRATGFSPHHPRRRKRTKRRSSPPGPCNAACGM